MQWMNAVKKFEMLSTGRAHSVSSTPAEAQHDSNAVCALRKTYPLPMLWSWASISCYCTVLLACCGVCNRSSGTCSRPLHKLPLLYRNVWSTNRIGKVWESQDPLSWNRGWERCAFLTRAAAGYCCWFIVQLCRRCREENLQLATAIAVSLESEVTGNYWKNLNDVENKHRYVHSFLNPAMGSLSLSIHCPSCLT